MQEILMEDKLLRCSTKCKLFKNYEVFCVWRVPRRESDKDWRYRHISFTEIGYGLPYKVHYGYCTSKPVLQSKPSIRVKVSLANCL
jgi:hypothetical protein